jgi:transposase-like protein
MDFPQEHRLKMHGANLLERLNGEIERRADVVGILFDWTVSRRPVGELLTEPNDVHTI